MALFAGGIFLAQHLSEGLPIMIDRHEVNDAWRGFCGLHMDIFTEACPGAAWPIDKQRPTGIN